MIHTGADLNQLSVAIEMDQVAVQGVFADSNALRFQVDLEFVDTEGSRRAAEQLAHQPTQHEGLGNRVTLEYITQQNDMDRAWVGLVPGLRPLQSCCSSHTVVPARAPGRSASIKRPYRQTGA